MALIAIYLKLKPKTTYLCDRQKNWSMKMQFFTNNNLQTQVKFVWKTLVALILSVLLLAPTPALALDYNGTLQSDVFSVKEQLNGVLTLIKKLPNSSYENGQKTLTGIDIKLQEIQTNAANNAKKFRDSSDKAQKEYENYLNYVKSGFKNEYLANSTNDNDREYLRCLEVEMDYQYVKAERERHWISDDIFNINFQDVQRCQETIKNFPVTKKNEIDRLSNMLSLDNQRSKLYDNLEKRVNLAKQKTGNIKEYANLLKSFSAPDTLSEINELDKSIANLTNNLPQVN